MCLMRWSPGENLVTLGNLRVYELEVSNESNEGCFEILYMHGCIMIWTKCTYGPLSTVSAVIAFHDETRRLFRFLLTRYAKPNMEWGRFALIHYFEIIHYFQRWVRLLTLGVVVSRRYGTIQRCFLAIVEKAIKICCLPKIINDPLERPKDESKSWMKLLKGFAFADIIRRNWRQNTEILRCITKQCCLLLVVAGSWNNSSMFKRRT
jgi:hypothetical protein